ncbi:Ribonuclease II [Forsythia ovata]|uniref:Ribonuclease II n=1 Tax=Forsythia ovata TaxID=205694 RepID=A0ABD1UYV9_9LAMI
MVVAQKPGGKKNWMIELLEKNKSVRVEELAEVDELLRRKHAKEAVEKELKEFVKLLKSAREMPSHSKPAKSSWRTEEKIRHRIESLEAYAIDKHYISLTVLLPTGKQIKSTQQITSHISLSPQKVFHKSFKNSIMAIAFLYHRARGKWEHNIIPSSIHNQHNIISIIIPYHSINSYNKNSYNMKFQESGTHYENTQTIWD